MALMQAFQRVSMQIMRIKLHLRLSCGHCTNACQSHIKRLTLSQLAWFGIAISIITLQYATIAPFYSATNISTKCCRCVSQHSAALPQATSYLNKLPKSFTAEDHILVADPMLATGMTLTLRLAALPACGAPSKNGLVTLPSKLHFMCSRGDIAGVLFGVSPVLGLQVVNDVTVHVTRSEASFVSSICRRHNGQCAGGHCFSRR